MLYKRLIWLTQRHLYTPALKYFKKIFHFLTLQTSKLPKTVAKKRKIWNNFHDLYVLRNFTHMCKIVILVVSCCLVNYSSFPCLEPLLLACYVLICVCPLPNQPHWFIPHCSFTTIWWVLFRAQQNFLILKNSHEITKPKRWCISHCSFITIL